MKRLMTYSLALGGLRLVGAGAFVAPTVGARTFHLDPGPRSNYLVRLFAARNAAMTVGLLMSRGSTRRLWWQTGIACDALDVAAAVLALHEGKARSSAVTDGVLSLTATALGVAGLVRERGDPR
jgi:hypothetical protein